MSSKLEYLQRYMSGSGSDVMDGEKKKKKKMKKPKKPKTALGTRVVDTDDTWEQSAPSREDIEKKWELDAAEDEKPLVVGVDGEGIEDPQDLPVYVDSDKYLDELQGKKKLKQDDDLSPPRKRTQGKSREEDSPPRRPKREDSSPPRRRSDATSRRLAEASEDDASPPRRKLDEDSSPSRRRPVKDRSSRGRHSDDDASPPRRSSGSSRRACELDSDDASPPRRGKKEKAESLVERKSSALKREDASSPRRSRQDDDASPPRRSHRDEDASPPRNPRRGKKDVESPSALNEGATSPPRRSRRDEDSSPSRKSRQDDRKPIQEERRRRDSPSRSPAIPDRQRRVDSLGRDIPYRPSRSERRSRSASKEKISSSRSHGRKAVRSRSRSRGRRSDHVRDTKTSPRRGRRRRSHSRSPRPSRRRDSRSPSHHRHSSKRSSRRSSPRHRERSYDRSRSHSRSRRNRRSTSPSRRSRSRSHSPLRRPSRHESVDVNERSSTDRARKTSLGSASSPQNAKSEAHDKEVKRKRKMAIEEETVKKAGLFTADEFEHQRKIAAKKKDLLQGVDASEMGANAETVYRDKRGRKLDMLNEMVRQQEVLDGKRKREEREEYEWGTGEVQKRERKSQQELMEQMKQTPFARHEDDEELERKRRERVRAFDPMNSKLFQEDPLAEGKSKKKRKKDKKKASKAKPKYAGPPAPPNRFGIRPGYRWDGVVRGTNWEEKVMMRQNANTAVSEEAYKYAVADM